jgi:hypothetical protein
MPGELLGMCRWFHEFAYAWGTSASERRLHFPGENDLTDPHDVLWRGVTIHAPTAVSWAWLCQLRVAPYSYDWLDNVGRRSPRQRTDSLQDIQVGQRLMTIFDVTLVEPRRALAARIHQRGPRAVFGDVLVCYLLTEDRTENRLLARVAVRYNEGWRGRLLRAILPFGDALMMRRQLLTLKALAESEAAKTR